MDLPLQNVGQYCRRVDLDVLWLGMFARRKQQITAGGFEPCQLNSQVRGYPPFEATASRTNIRCL